MDSTAVGPPIVLVEQISFTMPIIMAVVTFIVTQLAKRLPLFDKVNPYYVLWGVALLGTFALALFYQPDMTVGQVWMTAGFFVANAGALHIGKRFLWTAIPKLLSLFTTKSRFPR